MDEVIDLLTIFSICSSLLISDSLPLSAGLSRIRKVLFQSQPLHTRTSLCHVFLVCCYKTLTFYVSVSVCIVQNNGGCSKYARCQYMGQGQLNCTCVGNHVGDGYECRGRISKVRIRALTFSIFCPLHSFNVHNKTCCCLPILQELTQQPENSFFQKMINVSQCRSSWNLSNILYDVTVYSLFKVFSKESG